MPPPVKDRISPANSATGRPNRKARQIPRWFPAGGTALRGHCRPAIVTGPCPLFPPQTFHFFFSACRGPGQSRIFPSLAGLINLPLDPEMPVVAGLRNQ